MPKGSLLNPQQTKEIAVFLQKGLKTIEIAKKLCLDHRTVKRYLEKGVTNNRKGKSGRKKALKNRESRKVKLSLSKMPHSSSSEVFEDAGVKKVSKTTRCKYLNKIASMRMPIRKPKLTPLHRQKRIKWAGNYMKTNFANVLWTDECRATLDGPDGWSKGWLLTGQSPTIQTRRQQGGGGVMFWAGIINDTIVGPFRVPDGLKMNSQSYCNFLETNLVPWMETQTGDFIFQQDNAPSHASKFTTAWRETKRLTGDRFMEWPPNSPDLNPIENLWSVVKRKLYAGSRQFETKDQLWEAIKLACSQVDKETIKSLTSSVDRRLLKVIEKKGGHV